VVVCRVACGSLSGAFIQQGRLAYSELYLCSGERTLISFVRTYLRDGNFRQIEISSHMRGMHD